MSCCQGKRSQFRQNVPIPPPGSDAQPLTQQRAAQVSFVYFEYNGKSGLTAVGPITGRRYRFDATGAVVAVDGRDAPSLSAVPNLTRRA